LPEYAEPVEIGPKGHYDLSAQVIGRISTLPGVLEISEM
jgi:hypothetical protein